MVHKSTSTDTATASLARPRPARRVGTRPRGFAAMDPAKQRDLAQQGGLASHAKGKGHKWTAEEAREAGRKGGLISRRGPARIVAA